MNRRLIELSLPLSEIREASARENNVRSGPPLTLHPWWGRQKMSPSRAIVLASLIDDPGAEQCHAREELLDHLKSVTSWDTSDPSHGESEEIERARELLHTQYGRRPRVLDPFAGSGPIPFESLRLGCETHAGDYNPVAYLIEMCTLVFPQQYGEQLGEDVRVWGQWVLNGVRDEMGHLYANPLGDELITDYLWARAVTCPVCEDDIPLVYKWRLADKPGRRIALKPVIERDTGPISFQVLTGDELQGFDAGVGTVGRGRVTCLHCGSVADMGYVRGEAEAGRIGQVPLAVVFREAQRGRGYRPFTEQDMALFRESELLLAEREDKIPGEHLADRGPTASQTQRYGLKRWRDLFNARQLLIILAFSDRVRQAFRAMLNNGVEPERARAITTYLAMSLDRMVQRNSSLTRWVPQRESGAEPTLPFGLMMLWDYAELNPLAEVSNYWESTVARAARAIQYAAASSQRPAIVQQVSATHLPYPDGYFDAIITDPPYYEAVHYADLSDVFYVLLKRSLAPLYPALFSTDLSPKLEEIILLPSESEDEGPSQSSYLRELAKAFAEMYRVLDPDGVLVVTYPARSYAALETLFTQLLQTGLATSAAWPVRTERVQSKSFVRPHDEDWPSTIVTVCRKHARQRPQLDYEHVRARIRARVREFLGQIATGDLSAADLVIAASGPAMEIFGRYELIAKAGDDHATVSDVISTVEDEVIDFCLIQELEGNDAH